MFITKKLLKKIPRRGETEIIEKFNKFGEHLTIRGRMAYGLACLAAYFEHHNIDWRQYTKEIEMLSEYTSSANLAKWEQDAKHFLFGKYSDEQCSAGVPHLFELLYYVGAGDMYGQYQGASANELYLITAILKSDGIALPDNDLFTEYCLISPTLEDDYYGLPFLCPNYFSEKA